VRAPSAVYTIADDLPLNAIEAASDAYLYRAERDGYRLEVFPRGSPTAGVRLSHAPSDTSLRFALMGAARGRTVSGSTATAELSGLTARWHSMTDRVKEELLLPSRPPNDEIPFELEARGLTLTPDEVGGLVARDRSGAEIYRILRPTATDSAGERALLSLAADGARATIRLPAPFAASASYPITVDPTVISSGIGRRSVAYGNSVRLLEDGFGKLLLVGWGGGRRVTGAWSNDGGGRWFSQATEEFGVSSDAAPTWVLAPDGTSLHMVCHCGGDAIQYGRWTIERDAINDISALRPPPGLLTLSDTAERVLAGMPSLVLDRSGLPAVAWTQTRMADPRTGAVAFLRARGDPSLRENWVNAEGTTTNPDLLGSQTGAAQLGAVTLVRMPAGTPALPNDDGLYLFWIDPAGPSLRWSRAQGRGTDYTAWTPPVDKSAALISDALVPAAASDSRNRGVLVAWPVAAGRWRIERKSAADDGDAADIVIADGAVPFDQQLSLGVDRGDVYVASSKAGAEIALRSYDPERGWGPERVVAYAGSDSYPTIRSHPSDGFVDIAWANVGGANPAVRHVRTRVSRPVVQGLRASLPSFDPTAGEITSLSFALGDDGASPLSVRAEIVDSQGAVVRRLGDEAASLGAGQLAWDGTNDQGELLPGGTYTVRLRAVDRDGLDSLGYTTTVTIAAASP
jgi:hypothetical protein